MTTVAGAVVTIDGDSSGLVGALQKGEKGIADVKQESRKLSDQLKEVVDDADRAAGALVQKIGGPTAIKAIAGVGVAVGAAKELVGAFMESSEKLFQSYGDEGKRVWEQTEKGLFAVKGAFAEALLGGRDLNENAERMNALLGATKVAVDLLLSPVKLLAEAMWALSNNTRNQTAYQTDLMNIQDRYNTAINQQTAALKLSNEQYNVMIGNVDHMLISKQEEAAIDLKTALDRIEINRAEIREAKEFRANAEADRRAALVQADLLQSGLASKLAAAEHELTVVNDGVKQSQEDIVARAREMLLADAVFQRNLYQAQATERQQAYAEAAKMTAEEEQRDRDQLTRRENLIQAYEELRTYGEGGRSLPSLTPAPKVDTGAAAAAKGAIDETVYVLDLLNGKYQLLTQTQADTILATETMLGESSNRLVEMKRSEYEEMQRIAVDHDLAMVAIETERQQHAEEAAAANADAFGAAMAAISRAQVAAKVEADSEIWRVDKQTKTLMFDLAVSQNAKMVAMSIAANKSMAEVARAAIGNVISGLGDKAMMEAGEAAVAGNFAQASGYAVVGTTMYTVAAALGAQKKPNAGPPTERQQPVQNYAYNLRIDAAFADSESISRRFAQMQEGARQRGLIAGAA